MVEPSALPQKVIWFVPILGACSRCHISSSNICKLRNPNAVDSFPILRDTMVSFGKVAYRDHARASPDRGSCRVIRQIFHALGAANSIAILEAMVGNLVSKFFWNCPTADKRRCKNTEANAS